MFVLYYCYSLEGKDRLEVRQGAAVYVQCIRCLTPMERICQLQYLRTKDLSRVRKCREHGGLRGKGSRGVGRAGRQNEE